MKKRGSTLDFAAQRNADLLKVFRKYISQAKRIFLPEIFSLMAKTPARRFWVSEGRAAIVVAALEAGKPLKNMRPTKKEMFEEIHRRYKALKPLYPEKSLACLVAEIVMQPAPRYYLTPGTIKEFIFRIKKGIYAV